MRPPTFFQQCRDQQWYIHQLQALQVSFYGFKLAFTFLIFLFLKAGYAAQIAELKDRLSMQISSSRQMATMSPHDDGLIPHLERPGKDLQYTVGHESVLMCLL